MKEEFCSFPFQAHLQYKQEEKRRGSKSSTRMLGVFICRYSDTNTRLKNATSGGVSLRLEKDAVVTPGGKRYQLVVRLTEEPFAAPGDPTASRWKTINAGMRWQLQTQPANRQSRQVPGKKRRKRSICNRPVKASGAEQRGVVSLVTQHY
ncbi:hypothetical protein BGW36DRAFT_127855 [Talaromyces proteolyticus]|uniref:Uncharacterized protein n=1 Tax=Talaromyces proteolyticus TaxID=1131652 RepID=A0AAD4PXS6_9EURO|nr:uncharacterized protein BGW36DRAFT_127855 [Talaromyces proteolyticus]KAH8700355.1 hypothetical protein BGW36DRAFT_127855 [Talaromyces proteolyticus]